MAPRRNNKEKTPEVIGVQLTFYPNIKYPKNFL